MHYGRNNDVGNHEGVNMSTIDLQKKNVRIILEKKQLTKVKARVGLVLDLTGSMRKMYNNGTVQEVVERILAIASQFDDDGVLDVWVYDNEYTRLDSVDEKDLSGYVDRKILNNDSIHKFGRNDEVPVMKDVMKKYIAEDPSVDPAYIVFINDGGVKKTIKPIIEGASNQPIFWQFVGIGNGNFDFLKQLDKMEGRYVDNANFIQIENISTIPDKQLYDLLLNEFPIWLKEATKKGILNKQNEPVKQVQPEVLTIWKKLKKIFSSNH